MKAKIIRIGNSKGLRIPKSVMDQCNFSEQVELEVDGNNLIIKALPEVEVPRRDWNTAFQQMSKSGDDQLLDEDVFGDDEDFEWE